MVIEVLGSIILKCDHLVLSIKIVVFGLLCENASAWWYWESFGSVCLEIIDLCLFASVKYEWCLLGADHMKLISLLLF